MWQHWRPIFGWENLCPIYFADPLGILVIMPRAKQPVKKEDVINAYPDQDPNITAEGKPEDWGCLDGRILALDYGLHRADAVMNRRKSYNFQKLFGPKGKI